MRSLDLFIDCENTNYLLQKMFQRVKKAPVREGTMPAWLRFWQQWGVRAVRLAWGLAHDGQDWVLVGVFRQGTGGLRVQACVSLRPPAGVPRVDASWLSQALMDVPHQKSMSRQRLTMGLLAQDLVSGQMNCPVQVPQEAWPAEVQLEVAQALNLPPDAVNFDFEAEPLGGGEVRQLQWVGCARALVDDYQQWIRAAHGWQLTRLEPEADAAWRAAQALVGGLPSVLQQAPQDWQFRLDSESVPGDLDDEGMADVRGSRLLQDALASPAGPRLVAAGLALKAWT